jgi:hypothetical protein
MKAIADTGFVVAFLNRSDRYHHLGRRDWERGFGTVSDLRSRIGGGRVPGRIGE